jgi:thioredoxin 1
METKRFSSAEDFENTVKHGVTLVDFNAPWCGPCKAQEPIVQELSKQYSGKAVIAEMNIDENQQIAVDLGIQSIPTLAIFEIGKEVKRFVGLQSAKTLSQAIEERLTRTVHET